MSILIKQVLFNNKIIDLFIEHDEITQISDFIDRHADRTIDGKNHAIIPTFFNGHTHAAMTLFRGYADDMPLFPWLQHKIWPNEAKLTEEDVYWGTKLACLEMLKSGTTMFIDMYFFYESVYRAIDEIGLRAIITPAIFDFFDPLKAKAVQNKIEELHKNYSSKNAMIKFSLGPHAIYTVSKPHLIWLRDFAKANDLFFHIHLSETEKELNDCLKEHGQSPVAYLNEYGILNEKVIAAHCLHLSDDDISILSNNGVKVVHNPVSNMKLSSGHKFRYEDLKKSGVKIAIGTDGSASSNNLDLLEHVKIAALNQKNQTLDPTILPADEAFQLITESAEWFTGEKIGKIEVGYKADLALVNLRNPEMLPNHNYISNLVYSGNGNVIDTVLCNGKILMENRKTEFEEEIYNKIPEIVEKWLLRTETNNILG